jgi:hypothetical protein
MNRQIHLANFAVLQKKEVCGPTQNDNKYFDCRVKFWAEDKGLMTRRMSLGFRLSLSREIDIGLQIC